MLDKGIRILNFDNSVIQQKQLFIQYPAESIDLTGLAGSARLYMSGSVRRKIVARIPEGKYPTFIGSGDFHHITEILTSRIDQPFCLLVFDFHPDWDGLPPRLGCGSWVRQALKNKNITKCVMLGTGSGDLGWPALFSAGLGALANDRLEIYPYRHAPSQVYLRTVARNSSLSVEKRFLGCRINWRQLADEDLKEFTRRLIKRLSVPRVYISIDKDCLKKDFALTNWEEGFLALDQLLLILRLLRENLDILGLDVVGDYSACRVNGRIKDFICRLDHPKRFSARGMENEAIRRINERTNLAILNAVLD